MFTSVKTSKKNKDLVSELTKKLNLGPENVIGRIAFAYSISQDKKLDVRKVKDSGGKEYSVKVLFGDNVDVYIGLVCVSYNLHKTDKDIPRYIKMHIDDGLEQISKEIESKSFITGTEFLTNEIERGIKYLK
jgi:DNA sulfur modification protein DndE